jgi:hypothetical protein
MARSNARYTPLYSRLMISDRFAEYSSSVVRSRSRRSRKRIKAAAGSAACGPAPDGPGRRSAVRRERIQLSCYLSMYVVTGGRTPWLSIKATASGEGVANIACTPSMGWPGPARSALPRPVRRSWLLQTEAHVRRYCGSPSLREEDSSA